MTTTTSSGSLFFPCHFSWQDPGARCLWGSLDDFVVQRYATLISLWRVQSSAGYNRYRPESFYLSPSGRSLLRARPLQGLNINISTFWRISFLGVPLWRASPIDPVEELHGRKPILRRSDASRPARDLGVVCAACLGDKAQGRRGSAPRVRHVPAVVFHRSANKLRRDPKNTLMA